VSPADLKFFNLQSNGKIIICSPGMLNEYCLNIMYGEDRLQVSIHASQRGFAPSESELRYLLKGV
jgi:hypothetical protein